PVASRHGGAAMNLHDLRAREAHAKFARPDAAKDQRLRREPGKAARIQGAAARRAPVLGEIAPVADHRLRIRMEHRSLAPSVAAAQAGRMELAESFGPVRRLCRIETLAGPGAKVSSGAVLAGSATSEGGAVMSTRSNWLGLAIGLGVMLAA